MIKNHGCRAPGFSPQEVLTSGGPVPSLLLPLPQALLPGLLLGNLPAPHAFLASLLWHSGCGHLPASLSRYRDGSTPKRVRSLDQPAPEPRLCRSSRTSVFSTQRSVRAVEGARPRTKCCMASLGCLGLCLPPPLLQVLLLPPLSPSSAPQSTSPHPNSRSSGLSSFLLGVGSVASPTREPRNGHAVETFRGAHQ